MTLLTRAAALTLLPLAAPALADSLFTVSGTVSDYTAQSSQPVSQTFSIDFDKAKDAIQFADTTDFNQVVPIYRDDISAVTATIGFRGVPINVSFAQNSRTLNFSIPSLNENRTFTGVDRDDALDQLKDYLLENSGDFLRRFQRLLIKSSPNDPTAGNPNSLQSSMIAQDFSAAGFDTIGTTAPSGNTTDNKVFFGVSAGAFKAQGVSGHTISAPLSYTARFDADPRYQLQFSLPITYMEQGGAKTGAAALGLGFQVPLTPIGAKNQWFLTPRVSAGATGSVDAAAASILGNASLTSRYVWVVGDKDQLTIANMVGYNWSIPFHVSDVHGDYRIRNLAFKNGLLLQHALGAHIFGSKDTSVQASYAITNFTGTDLYMNVYHEVSLSIGTLNTGGRDSLFRLGVNGTFGKDYKKVALGFGYTF